MSRRGNVKLAYSQQVVWSGSRVCDNCGGATGRYLYDCKTKYGPWATLCEPCYPVLRAHDSLGTGVGQKYELQEGVYVKVDG